MAFWNAPVMISNHQYHATRAALGIRRAVAALNKQPDLASLLQANNAKPLLSALACQRACLRWQQWIFGAF